jgi:hypothetical protein
LCAWREALEAKRVLCGLFTCERPLPISPAAVGQVGGSVGLELTAGDAAALHAAGGCGLAGGIRGRRRRGAAPCRCHAGAVGHEGDGRPRRRAAAAAGRSGSRGVAAWRRACAGQRELGLAVGGLEEEVV